VTPISSEQLQEYNNQWLAKHPFYAVNGDNCQLYVKHIVWEVLGINLDTQNKNIGAAVFGAGIGATIVGIFAIATGLWIKGKH